MEEKDNIEVDEDLGVVTRRETKTPEEIKKYWESVDLSTVKPVPMPQVEAPKPKS